VALAPLAQSPSVRRGLRLVEAHLEAGAGRYAKAATLVGAVAEEAAAEGDPESGLADALYDLASVYAERAGGAARGTGATAGPQASADAAPTEAALAALSVFPNPFSRGTTVALKLTRASEASVRVYDVLGRAVAVLHEGRLDGGRHALRFDGAGLPAGVYLVRVEVGGDLPETWRWTERITLVR
jgi:hypothetical protein